MKFEKQVLTQLTGMMMIASSQWLISVLLVRLGSFVDAGIFSLAMSISNVFSGIADGGIRNYYISDTKDEFLQKQYILARLCTVLVSFLVCISYLLWESETYAIQEQFAIFIWLIYLNINNISDIYFGALQLNEKLYINGVSNTLKGFFTSIIFLSVYLSSHSLIWTLCAISLDTFLIFILYDFRQYCKEFGMPTMPCRQDFFALVYIIPKCFPLMIGSLFGLFISAIPRRTINILLGNEQLGYFSSVFAPAALISVLGMNALAPFVPKLSEKWKNKDTIAFKKIIGGIYGGVVVFVALAEMAAVLVGRPVMRFVFGEEVLPYYQILYLAIMSYGLSTMSFCGYCVMLVMRRTKIHTMITVVTVLIMAGIVGGFVEKIGIMGAALVLIEVYLIQCIIHLVIIFIELKRRNKNECR